jgi:(R,R)-butanediol dehydrogenase/meso-butanediol dehydrogenase/diacetyl reductase
LSVRGPRLRPTAFGPRAQGIIDPAAIVTRKVSLEQVVTCGFDALLADKGQVKVLAAPGGGGKE